MMEKPSSILPIVLLTRIDEHPGNRNISRKDQTTDTGRRQDKETERPCEETCSEVSAKTFHICEECGYRTSRMANLTVHMKKHTGENPYNSDIPESPYGDQSTSSHVQVLTDDMDWNVAEHTDTKPPSDSVHKKFKCSQCWFTSPYTATLIEQHMKVCTGKKPYKLDKCNDVASGKYDLEPHMANHGTEESSSASQKQDFDRPTAPKPQISEHLRKESNSCGLCDFRCEYQSQLSPHMKIHTARPDKPYKCDQCHTCFACKSNLDRHMTTHSSDNKVPLQTTGETNKDFKPYIYACGQCDFKCDYKSELSKHMIVHTGDKHPYKCDQCSYASAKKYYLDRHMTTHSSDNKVSLQRTGETNKDFKPYIYACGQCDFKCDYKSELSTHMMTHTGDKYPYKCDQCGYASSKKHFLDKHMLKHTEPYVCWCGFRTADSSLLLVHRATHTGENPYKCDQCDFSTSSKDSMEQHKATHTTEKDDSGDQNDVSVLSKDSTEEQNAEHTAKKDYYMCGVCDFMTPDRIVLSLHLSEHTGKAPDVWDHTYALPPAALNAVEKSYLCEDCGFEASEARKLVIHRRKHTGEKPYLCDTCGIAFAHGTSLTRHLRTHTGEKPHKCDQCDYSASNKRCLDLHMAKHTGEKPYACQLCSFRTANKQGLALHVRRHTGEKPYQCDFCDFSAARKHTIDLHIATHNPAKYFECDKCEMRTVSRQYLKRHMAKHQKNPYYRWNPSYQSSNYTGKLYQTKVDDYDYDDDDDDDDDDSKEEDPEEMESWSDLDDEDVDFEDEEEEEEEVHVKEEVQDRNDLYDFYGTQESNVPKVE
ncbi:zinc finger protein 665-like [Branchiostoma floridae]|uniref:Zinc finger protein 665-like n=1 Tax=Branchiostoma floridae TaxID=7739 RepID=A0A9J7LLL8_BRAFL|nr:zinc finger protein 665-like [Branchiostoma floridae]